MNAVLNQSMHGGNAKNYVAQNFNIADKLRIMHFETKKLKSYGLDIKISCLESNYRVYTH